MRGIEEGTFFPGLLQPGDAVILSGVKYKLGQGLTLYRDHRTKKEKRRAKALARKREKLHERSANSPQDAG